MYRDYSPRGVRFYYIYKSLAHPETNGYVTPFTLQERLLHVQEARRRLGSEIPWICDTMANDLKHALGDAPNSEFILDAEGRVARKRLWSDPAALRADLEELAGPVENPTRAEDVRLRTEPPPRMAARGVVPRIQVPGGMQALRIEPQRAGETQPFYVKLRAEADGPLLGEGRGTLYLGFHLDPIYRVHWNNLTKPIRVEIAAPAGTRVEPATLTGPEVEEAADIDPREFLVEVTTGASREPMRLTVSYFACNDEDEWCKALRQEYVVHFERDPDGGWAQGRGPRRRPDPLAAIDPAAPVAAPPGEAVPADGTPRPGAFRRPGPRPRGPAPRPTAGQIVKIDAAAQALTIRTRDGAERVYGLAEGARLMRNGGPAELAEFAPSDTCLFRLDERDVGRAVIRALKVGP